MWALNRFGVPWPAHGLRRKPSTPPKRETRTWSPLSVVIKVPTVGP
jgi:hypothetical protein